MSGQQWLIRVNGNEQLRVDDGTSVIIGRKPLRPIAVAPDVIRLDIVDNTKSMSKQHARLTVQVNGTATLTDLGSTNGTWVVQADGSLQRINQGVDFMLPSSTIRFQFGDVPVDFVRVEREYTEPVANLFSYAGDIAQQAQQERGAANLSVDDILDIRAGEPTGLLNTTKVRNTIAALHDGAIQDIAAQKAAQAALIADNEQQDKALSEAQEHMRAAQDALVQDEPVASQDSASQHVLPITPQSISDQEQHDSRDLFADAAAMQTRAQAKNQEAQGTSQGTQVASTTPTQSESQQVQQYSDAQQPQEQSVSDEATAPTTSATQQQYLAQTAQTQHPQNIAEQTPSQEYETGYQPVYEPGSVLSRLTSQSQTQQDEVVVDGYSSRDAITTRDYSLQFEIAQRPALVPYLAMNPALYDDLYAWLAAQGNADIDRALKNNRGYNDYLAANSGK
ncbi:variant leucine-rich repeat-containing protein [Galliscardovia ingluviei]|uniref:variant leucine-rich repeat-containing protein n=1 Tax=Galliscardovia ingluviei TaxID=1769422 RepID=UPI001668260E|nr:FHA domain-containing protein [Galliscardovia ingluviei]